MFSVEAMVDEVVLWVQIIKYHICIALVRSCEYNDFIFLTNSLQALNSIRTHIYRSLGYFAIGEFNVENGINLLQ